MRNIELTNTSMNYTKLTKPQLLEKCYELGFEKIKSKTKQN